MNDYWNTSEINRAILEQPALNAHQQGKRKMSNVSQLQEPEAKSCSSATTATSKAETFLTKRGITQETAEKYGLHESKDTLLIPYLMNGEIKNRKYRSTIEKRFWQDGGAQFVWNYDCLENAGTLIITEGELDAVSALQAGFEKTISIPNGGSEGESNMQWLYDIEEKIGSEIILAFDNDNVGHSLLEQVSGILGKARCKWACYPKGCKDLNDALMRFGERGVTESIERAKWVSVKGHYKMSELAPLPYRVPMSADMGELDNHIKLRLGDLSVLTGIPGQGKTTFANDLINRILEKYDLKACFASFENPPQTDHKRMLRTWKIGKLEKHMSDKEKQDADKWIDEKYMFIVPGENDDITLEWLIERMEVVVYRHGVKILVIDPWNEMDHIRPQGVTLTEYTGNALKIIKSFAKSRGVHVMIVAHPAKLKRGQDGQYPIPSLYDISDSQHWANKPDLGIVVHRGEEGDTVRTVKSRYHTEIGTPGIVDVMFLQDTGRFYPVDHSVER